MRGSWKSYLLSLSWLFIGACSSIQTSHLELAQDSFVTIGENDPSFHKRGETLAIPDEKPVLVESPGKIGVLVLPQRGNATNAKIALKPTDQWAGPYVQGRIDKSLNEIVGYINEIQILLTQRKLGEAHLAIQFMKKRYPKVDHLRFLEASYLASAGDRMRAATVLADLLTLHPDNQAARDFLLALTRPPKQEQPDRMPAAKKNIEADEEAEEED